MASSGDVEMADADRASEAPTTRHVLESLSRGSLDRLPSFAPPAGSRLAREPPGERTETDVERDLLAPFAPLLARLEHARGLSSAGHRSPSPLATILSRYEHASELGEYAAAIRSLSLQDLKSYAAESADGMPLYRQFEGADARERACIVLQLVLAFEDGSLAREALQDNELVRNDIYKSHLTAILVNALTADALIASADRGGISLRKVVAFCLAAPLGVDLIEAIVLNDPSSCPRVVDAIVFSIRQCNPLQSNDATTPSALAASATSLLPFELRQAQAACSTLAALAPSYATRIMTSLRDDDSSVAAAFVAFQLLVEVPRLREDYWYAPFVHQWMKQSSKTKTPSASALHLFLQASLSEDGDASTDQDKQTASSASFLEEAQYVMSQFRQLLIEDIVSFQLISQPGAPTPSRFTLNTMLNVLIGLLIIGHLHPEDHETTQLLRMFDKVSKDIPQVQPPVLAKTFERMIALMYVLVLFLCAPSAPQFAKMPSQREDSTKLVLQLAQQCIFSLYNTKAACPLFILSSVLLYTKSPSLLPFLSSFLGETYPLLSPSLRVENLHGVGDAILKPILTENVMAREVLNVLEPAENLSANDQDPMGEIVLRSIHGLLTEKSFLRHQHTRKLEEWMTLLLDRATTPVHPLIIGVLVEWIENYVMAFEYPITQRPLLQLAVIPLSPAYVSRTLSHAVLTEPFSTQHRRLWTRAALVLVYALQFNQRLRVGGAIPGTKLFAFSNQGSTDAPEQHLPPIRSSSDVILAYDLDGFQIKNIAMEVARLGSLGGDFEYVAPTLLRLVGEEHPHLIPDIRYANRVGHDGKAKPKLVFLDYEPTTSTDSLPNVSWSNACLWISDLTLAKPRRVEEAIRICLGSLFPLAILSIDQSRPDEVGPEAFITSFVGLIISREAFSDPVSMERRSAEALCMPHLVWRQFLLVQSRQKLPPSSTTTDPTSPIWIRREQLIEQPFYVFQNSHAGVLNSPPLLRLVLSLVTTFRSECIFQLRRRESTIVSAKKAALANEVANAGTATQPVPSTDPATQQFLLMQDCILVQSMLTLLGDLDDSPTRQDKDECQFLLYGAIDELLSDAKTPSALSSSPPLSLVIHNQGYKLSIVSELVDRVPSLKQLWIYWMHQPTAETTTNKGSNRSGSNNTPGAASVKAIADFVSDPATEKDVAKWQFRVRVFFRLCEKYFNSPAHTNAAVYTLKQILGRVRAIAVSSSTSTRGVLHAMAIGDAAARLAFVESVFNDAIEGCGPHPELRSELTQFLLNMKKYFGPAGPGPSHASPSSVDAAQPRDRHHDLDRIVFRAYQKILHFV